MVTVEIPTMESVTEHLDELTNIVNLNPASPNCYSTTLIQKYTKQNTQRN